MVLDKFPMLSPTHQFASHINWVEAILMVFFLYFFSGLKRYKILSLIGDGTYGLVYLATNVETRSQFYQRHDNTSKKLDCFRD